MLVSSKHRLELNNKQRTLAFKHAGIARHAWNWGVKMCQEASEKREKLPSAMTLHKKLVAEVKVENPWYYEVSKCAPQESLRNLDEAWRNYFHNLKNGAIQKKKKSYISERKRKGLPINTKKLFDLGKPNFKKKGMRDSFCLNSHAIKISGNKIKVPIFGWLKISEKYNDSFIIKGVVMSRTANDWFVSFHREVDNLKIEGIESKPSIGVDLGIKTLAILSDGVEFKNVNAFGINKRKLKLAQRKQSKNFNKDSKTQSNNYKKAIKKVAKIYQRIANIRKDATHKLTTYLAKNHSLIGIEDLNVSGMMKNRKLSSAIADGGFYEFRRQLEYKTLWYGSKLVVIDRFFPSSKTCCCCGNIKEKLKLSERIYDCEACQLSLDRDLNAAINIQNYAVSYTVNVCGELQKQSISTETQ
jgi:putative transposase